MSLLKNTSFVETLGAWDVPIGQRRYLLIPIDGCAVTPEDGKALSLTPQPLSWFSTDMGWTEDDAPVIADLELGKSQVVYDGIAQAQTIVRVV